METLADAAVFVDAGGERRLRAAVATADRRGRTGLVRRGQRTLATLERFRSVAAPRDVGETDASSTDGTSGDRVQSVPAPDVHFRSATESVKPAEGEEPDR
jgi:hypothetical protein